MLPIHKTHINFVSLYKYYTDDEHRNVNIKMKWKSREKVKQIQQWNDFIVTIMVENLLRIKSWRSLNV